MKRMRAFWGAGVLALAAAALAGVIAAVNLSGWQSLPETAPLTVEVYDPRYVEAGQEAARLLEAMRAANGIPGAAAAVSVDGVLVWAAGTGWADLENLAPVTPATLFRIGSTSKAVTATVVARLHDEGLLDVGDTVANHIAAPLNPLWGPMQIDQLLAHTAGFPGYDNNTDWLGFIETLRMSRQFASVEEGLRLVDSSRLLGAPGERFYYSSFDTSLAALVAERASAADFASLIQSRVRAPLGLDTPLLADHGPPPEGLARFYSLGSGSRVRVRGAVNVSQRWAGGGLYGRPADLVRLGGAWLDDDFISQQTRARFWEPMQLNSGDVNEQSYALGWRVQPESAVTFGPEAPVRVVHHGGVSRGAMSWLIIYPELGIAAAVNINAETPGFADFSRVEPAIVRLFAGAAGRTPQGAVRPSDDAPPASAG